MSVLHHQEIIFSDFYFVDPVSVQIDPPNTVPSLSQSLGLVCHDETRSGLSKLVVWYKDGQKVILREDPRLLHNNSLHFDSLQPSHVGFYQCETHTSEQTSVLSLGYLLSCKYSVTERVVYYIQILE